MIECFIYGMEVEYNDIQFWKNKEFVDIFGGEKIFKKFVVKMRDELEVLFKDSDFNVVKYFQFVEVYMFKEDVLRVLVMMVEVSVKVNVKKG